MTHKYIIELANGMPIKKYTNGAEEPSHDSWTKARETYINYEFVIEEALPKVTPTDKPKHLAPPFFSHDEMHELFFNPIIDTKF